MIIPFVLTSVESVKSPTIRNGPFRLYQCLLTYRNRTTGQCNPGRRRLAQDLGVSERTISRWMTSLGEVGWVTCRHTLFGQHYTIHDPVAPKFGRASNVSVRDKNGATGRDKNGATLNQMFIEPEETSTTLPSSPVPEPRCRAAQPGGRRRECGSQKSTANPEQPKPSPAAQALADELATVHPQPGRPHRTAPEIETVFRANPGDRDALVARIRSSHASWVSYWNTLPQGEFIPHLCRWLQEGWWKTAAVIRKPAGRALSRRDAELEAAFDAWEASRAQG